MSKGSHAHALAAEYARTHHDPARRQQSARAMLDACFAREHDDEGRPLYSLPHHRGTTTDEGKALSAWLAVGRDMVDNTNRRRRKKAEAEARRLATPPPWARRMVDLIRERHPWAEGELLTPDQLAHPDTWGFDVKMASRFRTSTHWNDAEGVGVVVVRAHGAARVHLCPTREVFDALAPNA